MLAQCFLFLFLLTTANALSCPTGTYPAGQQPVLPLEKCRIKPFCYTWTDNGQVKAGCDDNQLCSKNGCMLIGPTTLCCNAP